MQTHLLIPIVACWLPVGLVRLHTYLPMWGTNQYHSNWLVSFLMTSLFLMLWVISSCPLVLCSWSCFFPNWSSIIISLPLVTLPSIIALCLLMHSCKTPNSTNTYSILWNISSYKIGSNISLGLQGSWILEVVSFCDLLNNTTFAPPFHEQIIYSSWLLITLTLDLGFFNLKVATT